MITSIHWISVHKIVAVMGTYLQLRSAYRTFPNLKSPNFSSHFRLWVSFVRMMNLFVIASETDLWRNFRSYFSIVISNLFLADVTSGIDFFIAKHIIGFFLLECLFLADWGVVSIEVVVCRFQPIGIIHADLSNFYALYAGWTKNSFLSPMTSLSVILRFQLEILLYEKWLSVLPVCFSA
jgi:hypothetical protein